MQRKFVLKTLRLFIGVLVFLSLTQIKGIDLRQTQEMMWGLGAIVLFGLILDNIWATLFLWWTVFLFTYFKFGIGVNYVFNIFYGCIVYYITKLSYRRQHSGYLLNCVLWLVVFNLFLMILQRLGLDWVFQQAIRTVEGGFWQANNTDPAGFMGFKAAMGILMSVAVPILATRPHKWAIPMALMMFVPLYLAQSTICVIGAVISLGFVLWYRLSKGVWWGLVVGMTILGAVYILKVDMPMGMMPTRIGQWKIVLRDCTIHPITGWGLDSFRQTTPTKQHIYALNPQQTSVGVHIDYWDNPHNLYVSLFFEWGIIGLLLLVGYLRQCAIWFKNAIKDNNTLAITGTLMVFFIVSIAQFPAFLARLMCMFVPLFAVYEVMVRE